MLLSSQKSNFGLAFETKCPKVEFNDGFTIDLLIEPSVVVGILASTNATRFS
jgi:hypothetical protein